jgi:hypothetical protein
MDELSITWRLGLEVRGQGSLAELATELHELDGIVDVRAGDADELV